MIVTWGDESAQVVPHAGDVDRKCPQEGGKNPVVMVVPHAGDVDRKF